ncbi:MAG: hypothetical protein AAF960_01325 [Bacteroidota bacterium]
MSDWTPEDVDALFQEGSKRHEFEYNEAAWGQMEDLLDRRDKRRGLVWWFFGIGISLLLFFGYFGWSSLALVNKTDVSMDDLSTVSEVAVITTEQVAPSDKNQENVANQNELSQAIATAKVEQLIFSQETVSEKSQKEATNQRAKTTPKKNLLATDNSSKVMKSTTNNLQDMDVLEGVSRLLVPTSGDEISVKEAIEKNTEKVATFSSERNIEVSRLPPLSFLLTAPVPPIEVDESLLEKIVEPQKNLHDNHLVIGALIGSEISFTETDALCAPTWKAGLSVEYRYARKLALKVGVNYIRKDYQTQNAANYRAPMGFWENGVLPQAVTANCDVLELSLIQSYFPKGHTRKGFYVNAGLTSYLMLEEVYNYSYENPPTNARMRWATQNTNRHWMGIGEVSFGYNLPFTDKSSLQIAPYAQLPLTGVGHGQLKLFSSGVLVRYNFHVR